jgi:hypothetical protein
MAALIHACMGESILERYAESEMKKGRTLSDAAFKLR